MHRGPRALVSTLEIWWALLQGCLLLATATNADADVTFHVKEYLLNVAVEIHVTGQITEKDFRDLESGVAAAKQFAVARKKELATPGFVLNSPGGDVSAGAKIGRWARVKEAWAEVQTECSSACVLILAGAVTRRAATNTRIGIHRIYFSGLDPSATYSQVRDKMSGVDQLLLAYLQEMDVSVSLLEEMKSIPPDQVRYLSPVELRRFRLLGTDPAYQEREDIRETARYGLSREEYYKRKSRANVICRQGSFIDLDCWDEVLRGKK